MKKTNSVGLPTQTNNERFRPLINNLLVELLDCWQRKTPEALIVGSAYMITMKHWKEVKSECWQRPFRNPEDEIDFFKNIKCQFTGRLAYYSILYDALTCAPHSMEESKGFWKNEWSRYDRFMEMHADFMDYLQKGNDENDMQYFLRKNFTAPHPPHPAIYDGDPEFCTARDYIVSGWFAEFQYRQYVTGKLDK